MGQVDHFCLLRDDGHVLQSADVARPQVHLPHADGVEEHRRLGHQRDGQPHSVDRPRV